MKKLFLIVASCLMVAVAAGFIFFTYKEDKPKKQNKYEKTIPSTNNDRIITLIEQDQFRLHSKLSVGQSSRIVVPVQLPPNTVKWYYVVVATRDRKIDPIDLEINLLKVGFSIKNLKIPDGGADCNVYLLDENNRDIFERGGKDFESISQGSRSNIKQGTFEITNSDCLSGEWYIGFENSKELKSVDVALDVVAVVKDN